MLDIADLTDGRVALLVDPAEFAGGHLDEGVTAFAVAEDRLGSGAADDLATLAGGQFDVVKRETERNQLEREGIADRRFGLLAGGHFVPHGETGRVQNVGFFTVGILDERETGSTVRVVLDGDDIGNRVAATALEVNDTVLLLVTAAAMTGGLAAHVVAAAGALLALDEGLLGRALGDLLEGGERLESL